METSLAGRGRRPHVRLPPDHGRRPVAGRRAVRLRRRAWDDYDGERTWTFKHLPDLPELRSACSPTPGPRWPRAGRVSPAPRRGIQMAGVDRPRHCIEMADIQLDLALRREDPLALVEAKQRPRLCGGAPGRADRRRGRDRPSPVSAQGRARTPLATWRRRRKAGRSRRTCRAGRCARGHLSPRLAPARAHCLERRSGLPQRCHRRGGIAAPRGRRALSNPGQLAGCSKSPLGRSLAWRADGAGAR